MKKLLITSWVVVLSAMLLSVSNAQVPEVTLTIENLEIIGTEVFFDIFMEEGINSPGPTYLGNADLVLMMDSYSFGPSLTFQKVNNPNPPYAGVQTGYCSFVPANTDGAFNDVVCQQTYFNGQSTSILDENFLVINLSSPTPTDSVGFFNSLAKIDKQPSTHRLGRYKLTNYIGGLVYLEWVLTPTPAQLLKTQVFSLEPFGSFVSVKTTIQAYNSSVVGGVSSNEELADNSIKITPNPANSYVDLEVIDSRGKRLDYKLIDLNGRVLQEGNFTNNTTLNTQQLAEGTYFINIFREELLPVTKKIIIAK